MKNRHPVSQAVSKSLSAQRRPAQDIKVGRGGLLLISRGCRKYCGSDGPISVVFELFQRHCAQIGRVLHSTLCQFDNLGRHEPRIGVVGQS